MRRRAIVLALASGVSLSGCLSRERDPPSDSRASRSPSDETATAARLTADGVRGAFRVVESRAPTDDTASATFDGERVTVRGIVDPSGCNRPTPSAVRFHAADGVLHLRVGTRPRYEPPSSVECGNASFDYRCVLTVDRGRPAAVEVVHAYDGKANQSFTFTRD